MPQRHSKNNNDLAFFTYDERRKLGYGTQRERLGRDSIKPFDACCICLKPLIDPLCCRKGHLYCKECILECLLAQKKDIKRKLALFTAQQRKEDEEKTEKRNLERERELEAFERQNNSAVPNYDHPQQHQQHCDAKNNRFQGANSVKVTAYEEEALRTMKAFWLPSATPEAREKLESPSTDTVCPEGKEKLKLKELFPIRFTQVPNRQYGKAEGNDGGEGEGGDGDGEGEGEGDGGQRDEKTYMCPSCSVTLTNTSKLVVISTCGHVLCSKCSDKFIAVEKVCSVCNKSCKLRNIITLEKGGTGFAGHDDHLEAKTFKHVGSGTGMGLYRPAAK